MPAKKGKDKVTTPKTATKLAIQLNDPKTPEKYRTGAATGTSQADGNKSNNKSTPKSTARIRTKKK